MCFMQFLGIKIPAVHIITELMLPCSSTWLFHMIILFIHLSIEQNQLYLQAYTVIFK